MAYILSWIWNPFMGLLSLVFLFMAWGAVPATVLAIIGVIRRRCRWWAILMYAVLVPICALLFKGVMWLAPIFSQDDNLSTALFWTPILFGCLGAIGALPKLLREVWRVTNGQRLPEAAKL